MVSFPFRVALAPAATVFVAAGWCGQAQAFFPPTVNDPAPISIVPTPSPTTPVIPSVPVPPVPPVPFAPPVPPTVVIVEIPTEIPLSPPPCVCPVPPPPERPNELPEPATVVGALVGAALVAAKRRKK